MLTAPTIHAQENGDPGGDPANPLWNGMAPSRCWTQSWDAPSDPNGRSTYNCDYPDGTAAFWLSDMDSTLLAWNTGCDLKHCTGTYQETAAGQAYLDGPQPGAPDATSAGGVPASAADLSSLRSAIPGPGGQSGFAGQVLMPPLDLQPFASFQLFSAVPVLGRDSLSTDQSVYSQSYTLGFVNAIEQSQRQFGVASAPVGGAISRQMYDDTAADFLKTFPGCAPTAAYCGRPNFPPCTGMGCTMQAEIFRGLKVKGADALVLHWWEDKAGGVGWDVTWFDSEAGVSYRLATHNGADPGDFDTGLSANNQAGAQQLAALAERLVPWTGI